MEKKFEAKLIELNETKYPFVKAAFKGKDGNVYIGMMLIDTGSMDCVLNTSVMQLLDDSVVKEDCKKNIISVHSEASLCKGVDFTFKMGNEVFSELFYVNENADFSFMFEGFIGLVGLNFLMKHELVLDYANEMLYTSKGTCEDPSKCEFFFPMEYGIKQYGLPIIGLVYDDKEFAMIADSGANRTLLTKYVVDETRMSTEELGKSTITGCNNDTNDSTIQKADLSLLSIGGTEKEPKICKYEDTVEVISNKSYLMEALGHDETLSPVVGLLSSAFMLEHKWILDFGVGIMYCK